ncbi:MAG: MBL fold metallo-hydrolase [Lentisphaeria bacterium]|nr:MBL fold metallo-hydrolase [Lentisphaeria bacterium]
MKLTLLVDKQDSTKFQSEFGLAFLVQHDPVQFLFDTGAGSALLHNMQMAGVTQEQSQKIVLSHGHYDHAGGIALLQPTEIWCCNDVEIPHFSRHADGEVVCISIPQNALKVLRNSNIHRINKFTEIFNGVYATGPIPRVSGENNGGDFYHDQACSQPDIVPEEQALLFAEGILLTGCCHMGIINTILWCNSEKPEIPIHTIIGGLHLRHAGEKRLRETADMIRKTEIKNLYLLHCTGENAIRYLRNALPECKIHTPVPGEILSF